MANEAVIIELPAALNAKQRTVSASASISKGALTKLSDPNTVAASIISDLGPVWGGVAAADKDATDAETTMSVYLDGVFDMVVASGDAVTIGGKVTISGANFIKDATEAQVNSGAWIGYAEESGASAETIRVRLRGS